MNYNQAVTYIHSLLKFGMKPGLQRIEALLDRLGRPDRGLKVLHVAGTNGKGSTCAMLSAVLRRAGYKTGLFISPYVVSFRERIQINGDYIPSGELAARTERLKGIAEELEKEDLGPTEFEFITALALEWFADAGCGAVVLETGLGGRLDSTNTVENPLVSVITSISLDHTAVLGDTIEQIAWEKSGIIKPGCPVVVSPGIRGAALEVIRKTAGERGSVLYQPAPADGTEVLGLLGSRFMSGGGTLWYPDGGAERLQSEAESYTVALAGAHQVQNALTTIETVRRCGLAVSREALRDGAGAGVPGGHSGGGPHPGWGGRAGRGRGALCGQAYRCHGHDGGQGLRNGPIHPGPPLPVDPHREGAGQSPQPDRRRPGAGRTSLLRRRNRGRLLYAGAGSRGSKISRRPGIDLRVLLFGRRYPAKSPGFLCRGTKIEGSRRPAFRAIAVSIPYPYG